MSVDPNTDLLQQIVGLLTSQVKGPNLTLSPPGATITQPTMPSGTPINQLSPAYPLNIIGLCDRWNAVSFAVSGPDLSLGPPTTLNANITSSDTTLVPANYWFLPTGTPFTILIGTEQITVTGLGAPADGPLDANINASQTTLVVTSAADYPTAAPFTVQVTNEDMLVTNVAGTTFTVVRGANFTTAVSHTAGEFVRPISYSITRGANGTNAAAHTAGDVIRQYFGIPSIDVVVLESDTTLGPFYPIADASGNSLGYAGVWQGLVNGQVFIANVTKPYYTLQIYAVNNVKLAFGALLHNTQTDSQVTFNVDPSVPSNPAPGFVVQVDQEQMFVRGVLNVSGNTDLTLVRGYNLTVAAAHSAGAFMQELYNPQGFRIVATPFLLSSRPTTDVVNGAGALGVSTNATRAAGILHRNAVTAVDVLATPAIPTATAVTEAGSTLANVAYHFAVAAGNRWGSTTARVDGGAVTPTALQALRIAVTQKVGADYYDIFLSTDAAPLWVGRITEAQRLAGTSIISTVGVVTTRAGSTVAGTIDIGIVGTGVASTANPFAVNNAYTPASVTPIDCTGYSRAHLHVKLAVTDLRSLPTLTVTPFYQDTTSTADWFAGTQQALTFLTAAGQVLEQELDLTVDGATGLVILVEAISGQGAAASIWVELS